MKKTRAGPTQTRKKVLPPTREPSFSKIAKPEKSTEVHPKWSQRRTLDALKTHIEGALADGFHYIVALRPQAEEKCAKLCEKCPGKVPWAPKKEKQATESAQTLTKIASKSTKCWRLSRCVGILAKHKQKLKKIPANKCGHFPLRITFKNQESRQSAHLPSLAGEARQILKTTPLQKRRALHPTKNEVWKSRKSARST